MVERISEWRKDKTLCADAHAFYEKNPTPEQCYENQELAEFFFFRIYERWPEEALKIAVELIETKIDLEPLSNSSRVALKAAANLSLADGELEKYVETVKDAATANENGEKTISILLRWRLRQKPRPAGPFMLVLKRYLENRGNANANAELIAYLKTKISLEQYCKDLVP